ncbi:MAG: pentapeptide repeat-containing protein [Chloroflexi bacterium]|nr:pentapeptide repeat-containing protein [Chloroflexota bacterium]
MKINSTARYDDQQFVDLNQRQTTIQSAEFHGCLFKNCQFNETAFQACVFNECDFEECDLSLARFPHTAFRETKFSRSKLVGVNWTEANWTQQGLLKKKFVDFHACTLDYAVFIGLKLEEAAMRQCSAKHAAFEDTDLTGADCVQTDFAASRFVRTNLSKADFTGATNYDINAQLNTLHKTKFSLPEAVSLLRSLDIILTE